jgi:hypothetical protein
MSYTEPRTLIEDLAGNVHKDVHYKYILDDSWIDPFLASLLKLVLIEEVFHVPEQDKADAQVAERHQRPRQGCYDEDKNCCYQLKTNEAEDSHLSCEVEYESLILEFLKVECGSQEFLMPISDICYIVLLILWLFTFLYLIHSLVTLNWLWCLLI